MIHAEFNRLLQTIPREEHRAFQKWFVAYQDTIEWEQFKSQGYKDFVEVKQAKQQSSQIEPPMKAKQPKIGYVAQEFVLLNLPCSKPKEDMWVRKNGDLAIIIQGGYKIDQTTGKLVNIGVPYGATARLILFYIMSVAFFSETRKIYLGSSFDGFLKIIGAQRESRGKKKRRTGCPQSTRSTYQCVDQNPTQHRR